MRDQYREFSTKLPKNDEHAWEELKKAIAKTTDFVADASFYMERSGYAVIMATKRADAERLSERMLCAGNETVIFEKKESLNVRHPYAMVIDDPKGASMTVLNTACKAFGKCHTWTDLDGRFFVIFEDYACATKAVQDWQLLHPHTHKRKSPTQF